MLAISEWISKYGYLMNTPIIIFHGLKDVITQPSITKNIFNDIISPNKKLYLLEYGYHCLLLESNDNPYLPGYIMGKIIDWVDKLLDCV
jgi:alpha-beta hydrolase superfamily lysophospholipase